VAPDRVAPESPARFDLQQEVIDDSLRQNNEDAARSSAFPLSQTRRPDTPRQMKIPLPLDFPASLPHASRPVRVPRDRRGEFAARRQLDRDRATADTSKPLDQSFPDKVGTYARSAVKKNTAGVTGDATDSAEAKYTAPSGDITWTATAFSTPEQAMAMLTSTLER
jgi:hypothetical protein